MLSNNTMILVLLLLGLGCVFLSAKCSGGLGYRGISTYTLGMKVWKFSNKLFGLTLLCSSFFLFLISTNYSFSEEYFRGIVLIFILLSAGITELITFRKHKKSATAEK